MCPRILKKELHLSEFQKQVLIGYLLGDGCIETWRNSQIARLRVEQSSSQKVFVDWLFEVFKEFVKTPPKSRENKCKFNTLGAAEFYGFHKIFYSKRIKVVPKNIEQLLTPISFAVWFMGDGSIKSKECNGRILNTQGFSPPEVARLSRILNDKFKLMTSIRRQKDGLQIYISAKSGELLIKIISHYLLPYFNYKLPRLKS